MHMILALISLTSAWQWGDWRNWKKYQPAMMYFAMGNLLYNFLTNHYSLWSFKPDLFPHHAITEIIYTFITFPAVTLIFLSTYPERPGKQLLHILQWVILFAAIEWMLFATGRIVYDHGWSFWWSVLFDFVMFPMIRLFHQNELLTYIISVGLAIMWIGLFRVPVDVPLPSHS